MPGSKGSFLMQNFARRHGTLISIKETNCSESQFYDESFVADTITDRITTIDKLP